MLFVCEGGNLKKGEAGDEQLGQGRDLDKMLGPGFGPTRPHLDGFVGGGGGGDGGEAVVGALTTAPPLVRTEAYRGFRNDDLPQNEQNIRYISQH